MKHLENNYFVRQPVAIRIHKGSHQMVNYIIVVVASKLSIIFLSKFQVGSIKSCIRLHKSIEPTRKVVKQKKYYKASDALFFRSISIDKLSQPKKKRKAERMENFVTSFQRIDFLSHLSYFLKITLIKVSQKLFSNNNT